MQYAYQKLMQEHDLTYGELPSDAKIGIDAIKNIEKSISMVEKRGKTVSQSVLNKIRANDKWVVAEIIDYIEDTDNNDDELPYEKKEIEAELKKEAAPELTAEQKNALAIEVELESLHKSGTKEWDVDSIKQSAPNTFKVLFDTYDDEDSENGVETSYYSLLEQGTDTRIFTIRKK
jgi:hypothetical protein